MISNKQGITVNPAIKKPLFRPERSRDPKSITNCISRIPAFSEMTNKIYNVRILNHRFNIFFLTTLILLSSLVFITNIWAGDSKRIEMTSKEFRLEPDHLIVNHGQTVVIVFHNKGVLSHNLSIDGLGVKTKTIYPGETDKLVFVPKKTGKYPFRCTVPGHTEAGMRGTLVVH